MILLLPKSAVSSLKASSVLVQSGWCWTWLETPKTCFSRRRPHDILTGQRTEDPKNKLKFFIKTYTVTQSKWMYLIDSEIFFNIYPLKYSNGYPQHMNNSIFDMSRDVRKPVFGVSDQVRHKPSWEITEDS